ncbi:MAG: hypothetical protein J4G11_06220 [Acidimicrobiia bacterium]|nr:hypothetical protein [Acidimicrobiia bacterium]
MNSDPSFHDYVTRRQITDLVMRRVAEHVYERPLINLIDNVERADYVECLVELILQSADPRWRLRKRGTHGTWSTPGPAFESKSSNRALCRLGPDNHLRRRTPGSTSPSASGTG